MNKIKLLALFIVLVFAQMTATAQTQTATHDGKNAKTTKFEEKVKLTQDHISLLNYINGDKSKEGAQKQEVAIGKRNFKVGQTLSKDDSKIISDKLKEYVTANNIKTSITDGANASANGCAWRTFWQCDGLGNCQWVTFWVCW